MELRSYQADLVAQVWQAWSNHRRVLLQLPTGAGKTIIFSAIARQFLQQGLGVLVLAHRKELLSQAKSKLEAASGLPVGVIQAQRQINWDLDVQVASVQTLTRRKKYPDAGLVIIDEAHHAISKSYTRILKAYPLSYVLGVTATPCRGDGQGFRRDFDTLITGPTTRDLIDQSYLSDFKLYAAKQIQLIGVKKTGGDYNLKQLKSAVNRSVVAGDAIASWQKYANEKKTILFGVDVAHSLDLCESFQKEGIAAEHLDGNTSDRDRHSIIERFRSGKTKVLTNCEILTEGIDIPDIEAVQCVRPTCSIVLWRQMLGRALRPSPGKSHAVIIDHSQNWASLGLPDEDIEWSLEPISLNTSAWVQICPDCQHCFKPLSHETSKIIRQEIDNVGRWLNIFQCICPACDCQFEFSQVADSTSFGGKKLNHQPGEIFELSFEVHDWWKNSAVKLLEEAESTGKRKGWVYYKLLDHPFVTKTTISDWRYLAQILGYKQGWAWYKFKEVQEIVD